MTGALRVSWGCFFLGLGWGHAVRAQQPLPLQVNGAPFSEKSCLPLGALRTVAVPPLARDSVAVELVVVRGRRPIGGKVFASVAAFNAFDLRAWLLQAAPPANPAPTGQPALLDRPPMSPVAPGDRLCLLLGSLRHRRQLTDDGTRTYRVYNVPLCADR